MIAKVFLIKHWRSGPYANGDADSLEVPGIIFAADEAQAMAELAKLGLKETERNSGGFKMEKPYLEEMGEIETPATLPLVMETD